MRTVLLLLADYRVQDARIAPLDSDWEYPAYDGTALDELLGRTRRGLATTPSN